MATQLASGYIDLTVRYASAMSKIAKDFDDLDSRAKAGGNRAGGSLASGLVRGAKGAGADASRSFESSFDGAGLGRSISAPIRRVLGGSGTDAGKEFASNFEDEASQGARGAGEETGSGFLAGIAPAVAKLGTKAGPIGLALTAAIGLGAVAGAALAGEVMAGFERDMANRKLQVQLGLDPQSMANVNEAVSSAYKNNFGASVEELQTAASAILKNDLATATDPLGLQKVIEQFDTVAQVSGDSSEEIAAAVGTMVKSGLAGSVTEALDAIAVGNQNGLNVQGDLLDTLTEYGVQFQKLGLDAPAALGVINQLLEGGARNTDLAADALKEFSIRAIDGSDATATAFSDLGLDFQEMAQTFARGGPEAAGAFDMVVDKINAIADPVKRDAIGVALFGTQWEDLGGAIRSLDPGTAVSSLGEIEGAVQQASETLGGGATAGFSSLGRTLEVLRGKFQDLLAKAFGPAAQAISSWIMDRLPGLESFFTNTLIPALTGSGPAMAGFVGEIKEFIGEITPIVQQHFPRFLEFLKQIWNAAKPLGMVLGGIFKILLEVLPPVIGAVAKFQQVLWAIAGGGISLVTSAIQSVGNAALWLWNNAITPAWNGIQTAVNAGWSVLQGIFNALKAGVSAIGSVFQFAFNDFIIPMWHNFQTVVGVAWSFISPIYEGLKTGISAIGSAFSNVFTAVFTPVWEGIKTAFQSGWDFIKGIFDAMKSGFQAAADVIKGAFDGVSGAVKSAFDAVVSAIRPAAHAIGNLLADLPDLPGGFGEQSIGAVRSLGQKLQAFRTGGTVSGPGGTDNVLAWLTAGEGVVTKQAMANGGSELVAALNAGWVPPVQMLKDMLPAFAEGGIAGATQFAQEMGDGRKYVYGGTGPNGYDCSGFMSSIYGILTNQNPFKRYFTTESDFEALGFKKGYMPGAFNVGIRRGGGGPNSHMAGTLPNGVDVESGGKSSTTKYGGDAAGAQDFPLQYYLPVSGNPLGGTSSSDYGSASGGGGGGGSSWSSSSGGNPSSGSGSGGGSSSSGSGSGGGTDSGVDENNPYVKIAKAMKELQPDWGQLADIGAGGVAETFLPPGFANPLDSPLMKSASGLLGFFSGFIKDPKQRAVMLGISQGMVGDASGVVGTIQDNLPMPFGNQTPKTGMEPTDFANAQHQGTGALPGPPAVPDPNAAGGNVTNDNSVHVAEGGTIGVDPVKYQNKVNMQQRANQQPQLGTRRFI